MAEKPRIAIMDAAMQGIREFQETTRGAAFIKDVKRVGDQVIVVDYRNGDVLEMRVMEF